MSRKQDGDIEFQLPWGARFRTNQRGFLGRSLICLGVYELEVTEIIYRLLSPGMNAFDVGANAGYYTSLMAYRCGASGKVFSFEPHPVLFSELSFNANLQGEGLSIGLHNVALSESSGSGNLYIPNSFDGNSGVSTLEDTSECKKKIQIQKKRLDEIFEKNIDMLKIDVEGHELSVIKGCGLLLEKIRTIVFEDWNGNTVKYLKGLGWEVHLLGKSIKGPQLLPVTRKPGATGAPNFIAFKDKSIRQICEEKGWSCLKKQR